MFAGWVGKSRYDFACSRGREHGTLSIELDEATVRVETNGTCGQYTCFTQFWPRQVSRSLAGNPS